MDSKLPAVAWRRSPRPSGSPAGRSAEALVKKFAKSGRGDVVYGKVFVAESAEITNKKGRIGI